MNDENIAERNLSAVAMAEKAVNDAQKAMERRKRTRIVMAATPIILGFVTSLIGSGPLYIPGFVSAVLVLAGATMFSYLYLSGAFSRHERLYAPSDFLESETVKHLLKPHMPSALEQLSLLDEPVRNDLIGSIKAQIKETLTSEFVNELAKKYDSEIAKAAHLVELRTMFQSSKQRLLDEISALSRRSIFNLSIGAGATAGAILQLWYTMSRASDLTAVTDWKAMIPLLTLRLSVAIFIEVFAFFFLRMYKLNLQEIKYFHNELTNLELKFIALESTVGRTAPETLAQLVKDFSTTERNFILKTGESTVEGERMRLEQQGTKELIDAIKGLIPGKDK